MATWLFTQASARDTAAKPPSTPHTNGRPGSQRRTCGLIGRTPSTLVLCRRVLTCSAGRPSAVSNGQAPTRRAQGTGTKRIITTHFQPTPRMTCVCVERTASRSPPVAVSCRPRRRSIVSSAPRTLGAPGGTKRAPSHPNSSRLAWRADQVARFNTRWSFVTRCALASPITRQAAVTVRAPGVKSAPSRHAGAWYHTRREKRGAKGAKIRMIASGRGGMACPPAIA
jgi:hypothetical protein